MNNYRPVLCWNNCFLLQIRVHIEDQEEKNKCYLPFGEKHPNPSPLLCITHIYVWKCLFTGTVPVNKNYPTGTVPVNKIYPTGTVPVNKKYPTCTVPVNKDYRTGTVPLNNNNPKGTFINKLTTFNS